MSKIGSQAPNFKLPSHDGEPIELKDFIGNKNIILSFHIFSFTGGWTHQVSSFRIHNTSFEEANTQVLGISCDSRPTQVAFASSLGSIPYPILSDFYPHGEVSKAYEVFDDVKGTPKRAIVIIDKNGTVQFSKTYNAASDLDPKDIFEEIKKL